MLDPRLLMMLAVGTLLLVNGILDMGRRRRAGSGDSVDGVPEQSPRIDQGL